MAIIASLAKKSFVFSFWMGASLAAWANTTVTVGDPTKPADLPQAIYAAHQGGARDITIRPGTYDLPSMKAKETIILDKWQDTTIHAPAVILIFEELDHSALLMTQCKNVTWDGGTLEYVHPSYTQGRVMAVGSDSQGAYCDWQIDAGYPTDVDPVNSSFNVIDSTSHLFKLGTGDWSPPASQAQGKPGAFRLHYKDTPGFAVNDWLVTRAPGGSQSAHIDGCENCTLENLTILNGGFGDFFETGGLGGNHYLKCKIQPAPRPPGATEDEVISDGADGFHSFGTAKGPDIEDCVFTGVFLDDCIAVHGVFDRVISANGKTLVLKQGKGNPIVGDPLRISDGQGFFGQATVTAIQKRPDGNTQVTLDRDLHVPIDNARYGTEAANPNRCGRGYKILRCHLGDTRSRGILVKADDGIIDGNTIEGCGMSGVSIGPEYCWYEADYSWNVTVSNNTFRYCSKNNGDQGTIWVHWDGAIGNRSIKIKNNVIDTGYGQYIIRIEGADGIQITGNKISNSFTVNPSKPSNVIWLNHSKNVTLHGNTITHQGTFAGPVIQLDPSMNSNDVKNNNRNGIVVTGSSPP